MKVFGTNNLRKYYVYVGGIRSNNKVNNINKLLFDEINELPFDEIDNSSDNDNKEFMLASLDALLKKNLDNVRLRTVSQYLHLVQDYRFSKLSASELLARSVNKSLWYTRVIHLWANQWLNKSKIFTSRRGCYAKIKLLLYHKDFKLSIFNYLRANKFTLSIHHFIKFVEEEAIPAAQIRNPNAEIPNAEIPNPKSQIIISIFCQNPKSQIPNTSNLCILASQIPNYLGFEQHDYKDHLKNIYFDGYERDDVVAYRNQFINQIINLRPRFTVYEGEDMEKNISPVLSPNICELVLVTHDKSSFYANNSVIKTWGPIEKN
ncbi:hypothetical protein Glove_433g31 [Diversispora epigaea]|uniref:Uncharacterized protein n=1 Tax=Diversispora epigaea TaxID=1348612 RepID=A0A397H0J6_9GLOM|nr:hypothetical protein Glove_433g32 [Diversispora epigaea]RHZ53890.1 hypothetical protein Glove_433g31 [Diversispora epigaea]